MSRVHRWPEGHGVPPASWSPPAKKRKRRAKGKRVPAAVKKK